MIKNSIYTICFLCHIEIFHVKIVENSMFFQDSRFFGNLEIYKKAKKLFRALTNN